MDSANVRGMSDVHEMRKILKRREAPLCVASSPFVTHKKSPIQVFDGTPNGTEILLCIRQVICLLGKERTVPHQPQAKLYERIAVHASPALERTTL
ncbi:hypothetical protein Trydic_g19744 [Trypoxylus dichotomus]